MTDVDFLLSVLADGEAHSQAEILRRSFDERGHGLTVHSRAADLRRQGHAIEVSYVAGERRGRAYVYRLLSSLPTQATAVACVGSEAKQLALLAPPNGKPVWA